VTAAETDVSTPGFTELVEQNKRRVYALARELTGSHHDAEDLTQEVFIKAHRALDDFRGDAKPFTWLYRITMNTYLNTQRKKAVTEMELQEDFDRTSDETGQHPDADERAERSQMQAHIEASLDVLSDRERMAFVLKHYEDMKIKDVAAAMDVATGTVKSMLYRATRKLRDELSFYEDEL